MAFDAGTAHASYILSIDQPIQAAAQLKTLFAGIAADAAKAGKAAPGRGAAPTADEIKYAQAIARTAEAQARLAVATNKRAESDAKAARAISQTALIDQKRATEAAKTAAADDRAALSASRRAAAEARAAQAPAAGLGTRGGLSILPRELTQFGPQALQQIQSGLLGIVGPAALVTAGFAAFGSAIKGVEDSFKLKARLDETTRSIGLQLHGVRESGIAFQQAGAFAAKYGLTQEETNQALLASVGILRNSTASAGDLLGVLARLQVVSPEQSLQEAALAVKELQSGDITSLVKRFEISRAAANKMKQEIQGGGDAVSAIAGYLDGAGVKMDVLANRTTGAAGKLRLLTQEQEKYNLAVAGQAGGVGEAILDARINLTKELTAILSGDFTEINARNAARVEGQKAYNAAIQQGKTDAQAMVIAQQAMTAAEESNAIATATARGEHNRLKDDIISVAQAANISATALNEEAQKKLADQIETEKLNFQQRQLEADSLAAANGLLGAGDQAILLAKKYGIATDAAQFLIDAQARIGSAAGLAEQRAGERGPGGSGRAEANAVDEARQAQIFARLAQPEKDRIAAKAKQDADKAAADADRLADLQLQGRLIKAKGNAEKIAILNEQLRKTTDPIERQLLQNQIDSERLSGAKKLTSEADKRLKTEESIFDAQNKQIDAQLNLNKLQIDNTRASTQDARDRARLIAARDSGRQSPERLAAINLRLLEIDNDAAIRAQKIREAAQTAGGTITAKGQLLQSKQRGGGAIPAPVGGIPAPGSIPAPVGAAGLGGPVVNITLNIDKSGRVSATGDGTINILLGAGQTSFASGGA